MILFHGKESNPRSLVKAVSWRLLGSIDTFALSWFFTINAVMAGTIASTEVLTKICLYYVHERAWAQSSWGLRHHDPAHKQSNLINPADTSTTV